MRIGLSYFGGKGPLAHVIARAIDRIPHRCYAEVFGGAVNVFFARSRPAKSEAINDADGDIINLFRVLQRHPDEFRRLMRWRISSPREFESLVRADAADATDVERAVRRYIIMRQAMVAGPSKRPYFARRRRGVAASEPLFALPLEAIWERLIGVCIDNLDWREFIARWDSPDTLFYLDPPYEGFSRAYAPPFAERDHDELARVLHAIKGGFVLSINDSRRMRDLYRGCRMIRLSQGTRMRLGRPPRRSHRHELLIVRARGR